MELSGTLWITAAVSAELEVLGLHDLGGHTQNLGDLSLQEPEYDFYHQPHSFRFSCLCMVVRQPGTLVSTVAIYAPKALFQRSIPEAHYPIVKGLGFRGYPQSKNPPLHGPEILKS